MYIFKIYKKMPRQPGNIGDFVTFSSSFWADYYEKNGYVKRIENPENQQKPTKKSKKKEKTK